MTTLDALYPEHNAIVSASAGTGKTWFLVARIKRLLLSGAHPNSILAITFTRKATSEIKDRLETDLKKWASADDEKLKSYLVEIGLKKPNEKDIKNAHELYEHYQFSDRSIQIMTFHSFSQEILKKFPIEANVPIGFSVGEQSEINLIKGTAIDKIFSTKNIDDIELIDQITTLLALVGGMENARTILYNFIEKQNVWRAFTQDNTEMQTTALESLDNLYAPFINTNNLDSFFSEDTLKQLTNLATYLKNGNNTQKEFSKTITEIAGKKEQSDQDFLGVEKIFLKPDRSYRKLSLSKKFTNTLFEKDLDKPLMLWDELAELCLQTRLRINAKNVYEINRALYIVSQHLFDIFQDIKFKRGILDYDDLEWYAYKLLNKSGHSQWVQYKLDQRINHFLIDEFQDTNPTQWLLLKPLFEEIASKEQVGSKKSIFIVGDKKQSIYGFRLANPEIQSIANTYIEENFLNFSSPELGTSYRSSPAIIDFVNQLFSDTDYLSYNNFIEHKTADSLVNRWGYIEILPLCVKKDNKAVTKYRNPLLEHRAQDRENFYTKEAMEIAKKINSLIKKKVMLQSTHPNPKLIDYSDILVLVRNRTHIQELENTLRKQDIPVHAEKPNALLKRQEIKDMVALLEFLVTPYDDINFVHILRSPLFSISDEDLFVLKSAGGDCWYKKLKNLNNKKSTLNYAHLCLQKWMGSADHIPIHDLVSQIYSESDIFECYRATLKPNEFISAQNNLQYFLELTLDIDSGRYSTITSFIHKLKTLNLQKRNDLNEPPITNNDACVHIHTIHNAKGMESPVVFLAAGMEPYKRKIAAWDLLIDWPSADKKPNTFLLNPVFAMQDKVVQEVMGRLLDKEQLEELNLFYVAITRAKEMLIISGLDDEKYQNSWFQRSYKCIRSINKNRAPDSLKIEY